MLAQGRHLVQRPESAAAYSGVSNLVNVIILPLTDHQYCDGLIFSVHFIDGP